MNVSIFIFLCTDTIVLEIITQFCEELEELESTANIFNILLNCFDKFISTHILNLNHIQKKIEICQLLPANNTRVIKSRSDVIFENLI